MDVCLCLHVLHPVLLPRRGCHTVERNIYSRPAASGICGCGRKLPCLYLLRPTVVSMYNYMQPIVASTVAIILGLGVFNLEKGIAIALVFLGVYIVTQSKSRKDFEKEGKAV